MTLDDAIRHCYEVFNERSDMCKECREEHRQLAKWLEELKEGREIINRQKAEIDILIRKKDTLQDDIAEKDVEIERLNAKIKYLYKEIERIALMTVPTDRKEV